MSLPKLSCLACQIVTAFALIGGPMVVRAQVKPDKPLYMKEFDAFKNKTLEQKVQELADREEIRELIARMAHRVAHGEPFADLYTEDGAYVNHYPNNPVSEVHGRKNIAAVFDRSPRAMGGMSGALPMIHNYVLEIHGNEATGISSNELRITENGKSIIASGYYDDRFRKEDGHWKFVLREIRFFHWVPIQEGWAKAGTTK